MSLSDRSLRSDLVGTLVLIYGHHDIPPAAVFRVGGLGGGLPPSLRKDGRSRHVGYFSHGERVVNHGNELQTDVKARLDKFRGW